MQILVWWLASFSDFVSHLLSQGFPTRLEGFRRDRVLHEGLLGAGTRECASVPSGVQTLRRRSQKGNVGEGRQHGGPPEEPAAGHPVRHLRQCTIPIWPG